MIAIQFKKVYGRPLMLAVVSLIGLLSALVGDGIWNALSWFCLGTPVLVIVRHLVSPQRS
jgi:hypothetical protein